MVTANINRERQQSSAVDSEDDEKDSPTLQSRLDRLYLESAQYNSSSTFPNPYPSNRPSSPSNSRDIFMSANTVPVYRHGRKFYVPVEEYERMRLEERRHRRTQMQKAQNLPTPKSHPSTFRTSSNSFYNPINRSHSHSNEYKYVPLRPSQLPHHPILVTPDRPESTRASRSTSKYYENRDDGPPTIPALPIRLPTTTKRSNSSDKVLDLRRTPQPIQTLYSGYDSDDHSVKRSLSAEMVQTSPSPQPQIAPRRQVPTPAYDYDRSIYPSPSTDATYNPPKTPFGSNVITAAPIYEPEIRDSSQFYGIRRNEFGLSRSSSNHSQNEYRVREANNLGSLSDDNSSSPAMFIQRRNTDRTRYRRPEYVEEAIDDDYEQQRNPVWLRSTVRSQSNDRLTEKKRVRFADMEGFTLETASDREQQTAPPLPIDPRFSIRRTPIETFADVRRPIQPFRNSFYQAHHRLSGRNESKLATDV